MTRYVVRRVLLGVVQVSLVMVGVLFLTEALPGDAAVTIAGDNPDPAVIAELRARRTSTSRHGHGWATGSFAVLHGDFGASLVGPGPLWTSSPPRPDRR